MQEILITFLLFGLVVLLASTRFKQGAPRFETKSKTLTNDRSATESQLAAENTAQSTVEHTTASAEDSVPAQPVTIVAPLLELEPEVALPLAASLPLHEVIKPETIQADAVLNLVPNTSTIVEATHDNDTQKAEDREHQTVLEEIAQLSEGSHEMTISTLRRQVHNADPMVRATAAMTLGELAGKNQGQPQEEVAALLNELLHDSNSEVQLQAAAALGKLQLPGNLT